MTFSKTGSVHVVKVGHTQHCLYWKNQHTVFCATGNAVKEKSGEFEFYNVFSDTWFPKILEYFACIFPSGSKGCKHCIGGNYSCHDKDEGIMY